MDIVVGDRSVKSRTRLLFTRIPGPPLPLEGDRLLQGLARLVEEPVRLADEPGRLADDPTRLADEPVQLTGEPARLEEEGDYLA